MNKCNHIKRGILLIFLGILLVSLVQAQESKSPISSFSKSYPDYVVFLPEGKIDSVFYHAHSSIIPVIFKVNKYDLFPNKQLDSIVEVLSRVQKDASVRIAYLWIGGSASPEGPSKWNHKLGEYRSQALAKYLSKETGFPKDLMRVENLCEDWYSFEVALKNGAQIPNKEKVLDILGKEKDNERRKSQIIALDKGYTWHRIIRDIFPPFRNARMAIVCHERPERIPVNVERLSFDYSLPVREPVSSFPMNTTENRRRVIAVKTNLLFVAALTANLGFEAELWPHWSIDLPVWYSPYDIASTRKLRLLAVQPEVRWWPGVVMNGHFIGLHTHVAGFNVAINDKARYQDPNHALWGMGLSYGYAFSWGKDNRWGIEFNIGVGFAEYDYDAYRNRRNGALFKSGSDVYWGVTRAGVNLSYKWSFARRNKKNR